MFKVCKHKIKENASYEALIVKLPSVIRQKIAKRKNKKRAKVSLVGYLLLQQMLQRYTTVDLAGIKYQESGKPYFENEEWTFSISHSQRLVAVALSNEGEVGLDIEYYRTLDLSDNTFAFFSIPEKEAILAASNPQETVIEYWSKKEALVKAVGGQMFDMANYTNVIENEVIWGNTPYYLQQLGQPPAQHIWLATSLKISQISIENIFSL